MKKLISFLALSVLMTACNTVNPRPIDLDDPLQEDPVVTEDPLEEARFEEVKIALIAMQSGENMGPVGCGDSSEIVTREATGRGDAGKIKVALEELFAVEEQNYGESGLYNALYQSNLIVDSVNLTTLSATVALSGTITSGGVCDDPRIEDQITQTVLANLPAGYDFTADDVNVTIDGKDLHEYFNLSGL